MSNDTEQQLAELRAKGWVLVHQSPETESTPAMYRLERLYHSKAHTECGHSLSQAISDAEEFDRRVSEYPLPGLTTESGTKAA